MKHSKTAKTFKRHGRGYNIEIKKDKGRNMNDPLVELEASKPVIKDMFRD